MARTTFGCPALTVLRTPCDTPARCAQEPAYLGISGVKNQQPAAKPSPDRARAARGGCARATGAAFSGLNTAHRKERQLLGHLPTAALWAYDLLVGRPHKGLKVVPALVAPVLVYRHTLSLAPKAPASSSRPGTSLFRDRSGDGEPTVPARGTGRWRCPPP